MANNNLKEAKAAKNDEFYTQFHDIEIEMNAYLEYDPDVFRGENNFVALRRPRMEQLHPVLCRQVRRAWVEETDFHELCARRKEDEAPVPTHFV